MTWKTVPGYTNYEVLEDRRAGVQCRSKKRNTRGMGLTSFGTIPSKTLTQKGGRFRLTHPVNSVPRLFDPDNLWDACFKGAELVPLSR